MKRLTPRDVLIILDVYKYRYLSFPQLQTLHFFSPKPAYRRLKALTRRGYLKTFTVPHIPNHVYYLDKLGAEIVATELQVNVEDLHWNRYTKVPKDYYFLRHFLEINDFRILITKATENSAINLLGFIPEYFGEKVGGNVKKYIRDRVCDIANKRHEYSHTPDGVFALEKDGKSALFFVEIDRGSEVISDPEKGFLKCVIFYLNYWIDGKWKKYCAEFDREFTTFRTLIITPSQTRLQNIREVVTNFSFPKPQAKRFLWITTSLTQERLFSPVWQCLDLADKTVYSIGGKTEETYFRPGFSESFTKAINPYQL